MFKYKSRLLGLLLLISISSPAQAQTVENNVTSESQPNQEQSLDNDQTNAAAINQTGVLNIGDSATYKIQGLGGRNVICPKPSFIVGSAFNSTDGINFGDNSSYAFNASFIVPLGGELGKTCEGMATTISRKTQYDLEIINARSCAELISAGINLNSKKFPTLAEVCEGVSLAQKKVDRPKKQEKFQLPTLAPLPKKNEATSDKKQLKPESLKDNQQDDLTKKSQGSKSPTLAPLPKKNEATSDKKQLKPESLKDDQQDNLTKKSQNSQSPTLTSLPKNNESNSDNKQLKIVSFQGSRNEYIALDPENVQLTEQTRLVLLEAE